MHKQKLMVLYSIKKKSSCLTFLPKSLKPKTPTFYLSDIPLPWVKEHKYLRVILSDDNNDNVDIRRQTRSLCARENTIVSMSAECIK